MSVVRTKSPPFNSTAELIEAVREIRRESGFTLRPPACLWKLCKERRLDLTESERHKILSELGRLSGKARKLKPYLKKPEETGILPLTFVDNVKTETIPQKPSEPEVIQGELFPRMFRCNDRPHHWPRRQR